MKQESYAEFYDKEYRKLYVGTEQATEAFFEKQYIHGKSILKYLKANNINNYKNVLEIGTGAGGILQAFKEEGSEVLGVDLGSEYIEFGKSKGINLINCSSKELLKEYKGYFNIIILSHVMEHFINISEELSIINELVNDNGYVYIELPGVKNLHYTYDCDFLKLLQNAHTYCFDLGTLCQIMRMNGFELVAGNEIIFSIFRKAENKDVKIKNYYQDVYGYLQDLEKNRQQYNARYNQYIKNGLNIYRIDRFNILEQKLKKYSDKAVAIYGTGNHTKLLLEFVNVENKILGLLDNNILSIGKELYSYEVMDLNNCLDKIEAIVISSDSYQETIYERIRYLKEQGIDIIKIY